MEQSALHEYRQTKEQLVRWLHSLADLPAASEVKAGTGAEAFTVRESLLGLSNQVRDDTFKVAVVGEYSSGKSSLLNVLLRLHRTESRKADGLLPTAITPTTAVITTLVYDEDRQIEITLDDGETRQVSAEQLNGFLTEPTLRRKKYWWSSHAEENEQMAARLRRVRVGCISPLLSEGVELVDTPGIGSINEDHARITRQFTAEVDAALFLVSVDPPMGEREMTFLQHIKTITDRCLFVQTKRDLGERIEHGEVVWQRREREHRRRIEEVLGRSDYPFFSVSAFQAASGLRLEDAQEFEGSGFAALEAELQRFLVTERGQPKLEGWLKRSREAVNQIEVKLFGEQEQLKAKLAGLTVQVAGEEDYSQWQRIKSSLEQQLASNARLAEQELFRMQAAFEAEVIREARRELALTSAKQLAESSDHRLQLERAVVKAVQYHRDDLLMPVFDVHLAHAQKALVEALGDATPAALQQFRSIDFEWHASLLEVDLGDLVETNTYVQETRRGGLGIVDFFLGSVKTKVTEHSLDTQQFAALVEKAAVTAYRDVKQEMQASLEDLQRAALAEMGRILQAAKDAAAQQAKIQQQDRAKCQQQLEESQKQTRQLETIKAEWTSGKPS